MYTAGANNAVGGFRPFISINGHIVWEGTVVEDYGEACLTAEKQAKTALAKLFK